MTIRQTLQQGREALQILRPSELRRLANRQISEAVLRELARARERLAALERRYPSAGPREKAQRLIDEKKSVAGMIGGVSGVFGVVSIPADLVVMTWLQLVLLVDIATLYRVNLKNEAARGELLDVLGYANGVGPLQRSGPKVVGKLAGMLFERGGLRTLGRAVPLVAAPITAYLNNQHIQAVGEEAVRFYEGWNKAKRKSPRASAPEANR